MAAGRPWPLLVGGALIAGGSFLKWATITVPLFGTISVAGINGDGKITLALGIALVLLATRRATRALTWVMAVVAALATGIAVFEFAHISSVGHAASKIAVVSYGTGLYCVAAGCAAVIAGVVQAFRQS